MLPGCLYGKYVSCDTTLFKHYVGSTWHGSDASTLKWIFRERAPLLLLVGEHPSLNCRPCFQDGLPTAHGVLLVHLVSMHADRSAHTSLSHRHIITIRCISVLQHICVLLRHNHVL